MQKVSQYIQIIFTDVKVQNSPIEWQGYVHAERAVDS